VAYRQISILPLAMQKRVVQEQRGKQKAQRDLPSNGRSAPVCGLGGHLPEFDTSTLNLIAANGQEDVPSEFAGGEEVGIIARGAMIPVVGSNTEVQAL
jgi:hypothetical protein